MILKNTSVTLENNQNTLAHCKVVELPKIYNRAGNLTPLNGELDIPFKIERVYYLYDVPGGVTRGGHAHRALEQYIIAASGSFDVEIDDAMGKRVVSLNRPNHALHLVPGIWRELRNFSSGAVCLVIVSERYSEADYIRDYDEFLNFKHDPSNS